ncbi:hypothetical protein MNBD_GAMMA16-1304 [hydrothermal vent metagenome]|uniref:Uncharacterized protein n=1 Tax=hydrothermal vent metagenome TaxID=652676 RepID=A0A3B0ZC22_9ZZZZ
MNKRKYIVNSSGKLLLCIVLCLFAITTYAKKTSVPLQLSHTIELIANSITETTLKVTVLAPMKQVKITVSPYRNIELLSVNKDATFNEVVVGQVLRFKVQTRRNNNAEVGYLAIGLHAFSSNNNVRQSIITLRYGEKKEQANIHKGVVAIPGNSRSAQERTIKMPASPR